MGSHPTLAHHLLAAEALELDPDDRSDPHAVAHLAVEHSQVRTWPDDDPDLAHELDHPEWIYDHTHHPVREAEAELAFDRLNPEFGVPADQHNPYGRRAVRDRETALALGVRVAIHDSRQNDPNPSSGRPARTTAWPTPSTPPATSPPAPATAQNGSGPNAISTHKEQHHGSR
jgi:hypothetical protein